MTAREHRRRLGLVLFSVSFGTNVSTPLLLLYQDRLDLSAWTVTALFAIYPLGLLPALLLAGPVSDVVGRKRVATPFVALSGVASLLFVPGADRLPLLYLGRLLLGVVSGAVFVVATAWLQELRDPHDPLGASRLTGMLLYGGFGGGALLSGAMAQWLPAPTVAPFVVHIALVVAALVALPRVRETVPPQPGRRVRINLGIPPGAGKPFLTVVAPTALAVFAFPSISFGLFPVLLRPHMRGIDLFVTGLVAATTTGATFVAQPAVTRIGAPRAAPLALAVGACGYAAGTAAFLSGWWGLLFPAAVLLGVGSGLALTAGLRLVEVLTDPATRGALTGSFYAVAYSAMTMPVLTASLAGPAGFGSVLVVLTVVAGCGWLVVSRTAAGLPHAAGR